MRVAAARGLGRALLARGSSLRHWHEAEDQFVHVLEGAQTKDGHARQTVVLDESDESKMALHKCELAVQWVLPGCETMWGGRSRG